MGARILYIEDNPQNMRLVRKMLSLGGHEMIAADSGHAGISLAEQEKPDLILIDINLPDLDGMKVTAHLKSTPELSHIPVIALTANAMHGDRERFLSAGCDGYLPKPLGREDLLNTVNRYLR